MNLVLIAVAALLYAVIGVTSAVRSYGYAKRIGSPIVGYKSVVVIVGLFAAVLWPINVLCERIILKQAFPHLLPPKKVKPLNPLVRIANALEAIRDGSNSTVNRLLNDAEYLRQRIAGLEQSQRDIRSAKDSIAIERDEANRMLQQARTDNENLRIALGNAQAEIARLTPPPAPQPPPVPAA